MNLVANKVCMQMFPGSSGKNKILSQIELVRGQSQIYRQIWDEVETPIQIQLWEIRDPLRLIKL